VPGDGGDDGVLLVAGVVMSTWMALRANRAEAEALAVSDFLRNDVLAQAGASTQARSDTRPDPDLKVRTALDRAAAGIQGKFPGQPLVEASIRQTIGTRGPWSLSGGTGANGARLELKSPCVG
jgi:hypothetical protein